MPVSLGVTTGDAITIVVPTRNRAYTLRLVAESYFQQEGVDEIIFVDDAGADDTAWVIAGMAVQYPHVHVVMLRNEQRVGASASRNRGVAAVTNKLVLFCDDDESLQGGYAMVCRRKLAASGAAAVSGRRVNMLDGETWEEALARFGDGTRDVPPYNYLLCELTGGARYTGDVELPFTNAVILTWTDLVRQYGFDDYYARGNGYREETDYQMNLFVNQHTILQTNDTHSIHLSTSTVSTGGQRTARWRRVYWSVFYTHYFYKKYWYRYAKRIGLRSSQWSALAYFAAFSIYREFLRPKLARLRSSLVPNAVSVTRSLTRKRVAGGAD